MEWGICTCHGKRRLIVNKKGLCKQGRDECNTNKRRINGNAGPANEVQKRFSTFARNKGAQKNSTLAQKKTTPVQRSFKRTKKATGEKEVFLEIWDEREHVCSCCGADLGTEPRPIFFSHLLTKAAYPSLRLERRNIWLKCAECHHTWEFGNRYQNKFAKALLEAQKLKQGYYARGK